MNKSLHRIYIILFFIVGIGTTLLLGINGYQYYSAPIGERVFLAQHTALKPSGLWGHGFGIIGSLMMIFGVAIYMIRKRTRFMNFGFLKHWLEFHIFLCTVGPILVLYHTAFKFGGIVAVSFWSMVAVVLSGVVGRFLYVQIPHTIQGKVLSIKELDAMSEDLTNKLRQDYKVGDNVLSKIEELQSFHKYKNVTLAQSFILVFKDTFAMQSVLNVLKSNMKILGYSKSQMKEIIKISKSKLILSRKIGQLRVMQKLFKYWHIVHLPFAITMFIIMLIHIGVTIAFGYRWIF